LASTPGPIPLIENSIAWRVSIWVGVVADAHGFVSMARHNAKREVNFFIVFFMVVVNESFAVKGRNKFIIYQ
jgi:hypothetical protein